LEDVEGAAVRHIKWHNREVRLLERLVARAARGIGRFARRISACAVLFAYFDRGMKSAAFHICVIG
jgi:hypothetical protein